MEHPDSPTPRTNREAWGTVGKASGYITGISFLTQSVLFLLDTTGALVGQVGYTVTTRGMQQDLADFYVAVNERMHTIWWNVAIRDVLGPLGYLALVVLLVAVREVVGRGYPRVELAVLFTGVGAAAAAASDLLYLSHTTWWRTGGFQPTPDIVASGRASELLDNVGAYLQWSGFLVLAAGFLCLGATLGADPARRTRMARLAYVQAAALLGYVISDIVNVEIGRNLAAVAAGILIGPILVVATGHAVKRLDATLASPAGSQDHDQPS